MPGPAGAPRAVRWALVVAATFAALVGAPATGAANVKTPRAVTYGINGGWLFRMPTPEATLLAQVRGASLTTVRIDVPWAEIEPSPPAVGSVRTYEWQAMDTRVAELARAGLRLHASIVYSAGWAATVPGTGLAAYRSRPSEPQSYAAFAGAVADRYGRRGTFWRAHPELPYLPVNEFEVWNEENAQRYWAQQSTAPQDYANLYVLAYDAIRDRQPKATIELGGLVDLWADSFLANVLRARPDIRNKVDAVGYHAYTTSASASLSNIRRIRVCLNSFGLSRVPLAITEAGFSTTQMTDSQRGVELARLVEGVRAPALRVNELLVWSVVDLEKDPTNWEQWFGLWNQDGTPRESSVALARAVRIARASIRRNKARAQAARARAQRRRARQAAAGQRAGSHRSDGLVARVTATRRISARASALAAGPRR